MKIRNTLLFCWMLFLFSFPVFSQSHPVLTMTKKGVEKIRNTENAPMFQQILDQIKQEVDAEIKEGIFVPIPKDMAGGYTHERHKRNFFILQKAGNLYQITGDEKYAIYVRDMLLKYAEVYPKLGIHPTKKSYATGKLFWQCLNDANWLVYVSQAYDCIYDFATENERKILEKQLFRPFADFLSVDNPRFFNRIHNHSTWGNAAVGMIGLVMNDDELIKRALHGLDWSKLSDTAVDNDGGLIRLPSQKTAGFYAQLDNAFSPDGYYNEGPYYQRYAMSPFILFAQALENTRPEVKIFEYRGGLLKKAIYALVNQTDVQGRFFPLNDAQKGMSIASRELVLSVSVIYNYCGNDPELLSVAKMQNKVEFNALGFQIAQDVKAGKAKSFSTKSIELRDGKDGSEGALGILRSAGKKGESVLVFKYTSQGLGHGHYDKLTYSFYDKSGEVVQDYGAARWVNIDQKQGGRYLPENKTWSKQTVAHNTLVVNEITHFKNKFKVANEHHSNRYFFDGTTDENFQIASAKDTNAYPNIEMHRTMALLKDDSFQNPIVIDVFRVDSENENQYDLPVWFQGHLLETSFDYKANLTTLETMGDKYGYQHIWKEAQGQSKDSLAKVTWFSGSGMYSLTTLVNPEDELIFARLGANDQEFNLRRDPCFITRKKAQKDALFVSIIEPHGEYSQVDEVPNVPYGTISEMSILENTDEYTIISFKTKNNKAWTLCISNQNAKAKAKHKVKINGESFKWKGAYNLIKN